MSELVNRTFDFRFRNPMTPLTRYLSAKKVPYSYEEGEIRFYRRDGIVAWRQGKYLRIETRLLAQMLDAKPAHARGVLAMLFPDYNYFESREGIEELKAGEYLCVSFEPATPKMRCVECCNTGYDTEADEHYCGYEGCGRRVERDTFESGDAPDWCALNA